MCMGVDEHVCSTTRVMCVEVRRQPEGVSFLPPPGVLGVGLSLSGPAASAFTCRPSFPSLSDLIIFLKHSILCVSKWTCMGMGFLACVEVGDDFVESFLFCQGLGSGKSLCRLSQLISLSSAFLHMPLRSLLEASLPRSLFWTSILLPHLRISLSVSFPLKLQAQVAAAMWHGWKGSRAVGEPQCTLTMPEAPGF